MNSALNTTWPQHNRRAVGISRRITQYCQLPEKFHVIFGIFSSSSAFLFGQHRISRINPNNSLRNPGVPRDPGVKTLPKLPQKFSGFSWNRRFITLFTRAWKYSLTLNKTHPVLISLSFFSRSVLLLLSNLCLGLLSGHFRSCFD
jgi:hypothetical protein